MTNYMFDTNIFNAILEGSVDIGTLRGKANFFATHVQFDELNDTPNIEKRKALLQIFEEVTTSRVPTESFMLGVSMLGEAKLSTKVPTESGVYGVSRYGEAKYGDCLCSKIKSELDLKKKKPNNIKDALIAETAIKNRFTLVTHDKHLITVAKNFGATCVNLQQVIAAL